MRRALSGRILRILSKIGQNPYRYEKSHPEGWLACTLKLLFQHLKHFFQNLLADVVQSVDDFPLYFRRLP